MKMGHLLWYWINQTYLHLHNNSSSKFRLRTNTCVSFRVLKQKLQMSTLMSSCSLIYIVCVLLHRINPFIYLFDFFSISFTFFSHILALIFKCFHIVYSCKVQLAASYAMIGCCNPWQRVVKNNFLEILISVRVYFSLLSCKILKISIIT